MVRFPYQNGALVAAAAPEFVVALPQGAGQLPGQGHWTRDVAFAADGTMFVSVGSYSNAREQGEDETYARPSSPSGPTARAEGVHASGLRNPVSLAISPVTGALWTSVNERDGLGDNLVPDFVTSVAPGRFFGWPWFYLGANVDPRHPAADPAGHPPVALPNVLLQAHSASLGSAFYMGQQFPPEYHGSLFLAEHGSWNRSNPTGSKVIRVVFDAAGNPQPYYEDFMTGFVVANHDVWGRPSGVAVDPAGSCSSPRTRTTSPGAWPAPISCRETGAAVPRSPVRSMARRSARADEEPDAFVAARGVSVERTSSANDRGTRGLRLSAVPRQEQYHARLSGTDIPRLQPRP